MRKAYGFMQLSKDAPASITPYSGDLLRAAAIGFALLLAVGIAYACWKNFTETRADDFVSYWAAGKLALGGEPAAAYDVARHRAVESAVHRFSGIQPFPYPPPFLFAVTPFALLPYLWALIVWVVVTAAFFAYATRRVVEAPYAFAHPSVLINGWIGQNGFLTAGIFTGGTALLGKRPFLAGVILGTLVFKPQLALLLPVAVIAAREWRAVAGAMLSAGALLLLALIAFGPASYVGFWKILPLYTELMRQDKWPWNEFISPFAFFRYLGVDRTVAMTIQALVALAASAVTWIAWRRNWEAKVPILAAATLLVPPYLLTYDALLLIVPMGYWIARRQPWPAVIVWFLCLLPVVFYFGLYRGPNTIALAAVLALCLFTIRRKDRAPDMDRAHAV